MEIKPIRPKKDMGEVKYPWNVVSNRMWIMLQYIYPGAYTPLAGSGDGLSIHLLHWKWDLDKMEIKVPEPRNIWGEALKQLGNVIHTVKVVVLRDYIDRMAIPPFLYVRLRDVWKNKE